MKATALLCLAALVGALAATARPAQAQFTVSHCVQLAQQIRTLQNQQLLYQRGADGHLSRPADPGIAGDIKVAQQSYQTNCAAYKQGVIYPTFQILTLIYSPPGCTGTDCAATGQVDYQSGSSTGTRVTTEQSFKNATSTSVDLTLTDTGVGSLGAGTSNGFTVTATDSSTETISKQQTNDLKLDSDHDGVDHSKDVFYLLMNPAIIIRTNGVKTSWKLGVKGPAAHQAQITVAALRTCSFAQNSPFYNKLKPKDCATILKQDPFAKLGAAIDPKRYVPTPSYYSYQPSTSCVVVNDSYEHERDVDSTHEVETEYTSGYSLSASADLGVLSADLKYSQDFTWTDSSSVTATTGSTQTASFTLPCPSSRYPGDPWVAVYWDSLYGTFMFKITPESGLGPVISTGHVTSATGAPARSVSVTLTAGGTTYRTATNSNGDYRFFAPAAAHASLPASGTLSVRGVKQTVMLHAAAPVQVRMTPK